MYALVTFQAGQIHGSFLGQPSLPPLFMFLKKGYIVTLIDHPFNNSYEHSDVFVYGALWQRPWMIKKKMRSMAVRSIKFMIFIKNFGAMK
jgi:hypothetical protein